MGFRRKGDGAFILGEWFDPNDCLMRINAEAEWRQYIAGMLNYSYSDSTTSHVDLRQYCCIAQVESELHSSLTPKQAQGIGKIKFAALKDAFARKPPN